MLLDFDGQLGVDAGRIAAGSLAFRRTASGTLTMQTDTGACFECEPVPTLGTDLHTMLTADRIHPLGASSERLRMHQVARVD